jgi:hypothetical protein
MQIDNEALKRASSMSDADLKKIINAAASEKGISIPILSDSDIAKIRSALGDIALGASIPKNIISAAEAQMKKEGNPK